MWYSVKEVVWENLNNHSIIVQELLNLTCCVAIIAIIIIVILTVIDEFEIKFLCLKYFSFH